jgi:hypothetical protein
MVAGPLPGSFHRAPKIAITPLPVRLKRGTSIPQKPAVNTICPRQL